MSIHDPVRIAPDWRQNPEIRRKYIGASEVPAMLGVSPYVTPLALYMEKRGETKGEVSGLPIDIGNALESVILRHASVEIGRVNTGLPPLYHARTRRLVATLDGALDDGTPVEAKSWGVHAAQCARDLRDGIVTPGTPAEALWWQVQAQMAVVDAKQAYCAILCDRELIIAQVAANAEAGALIVEQVDAFWGMIEAGTPPAPQAGDLDIVRARAKVGGAEVHAPDLAVAIQRRKALKDQIKIAEGEIEAIDVDIYDRIRDLGARRIVASHGLALTRVVTDGLRLDTKRLAKEHPDLCAQYMVPTHADYLR